MRLLKRGIVTGLLFATVVAGCASLPPGSGFPKNPSAAYAHPEETRVGKIFADEAREHPDVSAFRILPVGADGFAARMQMIQAAQRTLDMQYYIFTADSTGLLVTDALLAAADRGVHQRILIDDGETTHGAEQILVMTAHPNIEVRIFNPFAYRGHLQLVRSVEFLFESKRLDYRMHNKLFVADNAVALIGGRNIGDAYFQVDPDAQYADDDIFVAGPLVRKLSATFDEYWNSALAIPVEALRGGRPSKAKLERERQRLNEHVRRVHELGADYIKRAEQGDPFAGIIAGRLPLVWSQAQVVCDSPDKKKVLDGGSRGRLMYGPIAQAVSAVKSEFIMVTPYLVPAPEEMQLLHGLRQRNVRVRILTNSLNSTNELAAQAGYAHYRRQLLRDGVELYELRAMLGNSRGSGQSAKMSGYGNFGLHAKLFVFDRSRLYAGSMNFDQRSRRLNTETGLIIDSPELAAQTAARFEAMTKPSNSYVVALATPDSANSPLIWRTQENGNSVEYHREPSRSVWRRIGVALLSVLPIDKEL
ncbi:MAG: phospholipase D family protein [Steroidobacteraceae bacterium]